MPISSLA